MKYRSKLLICCVTLSAVAFLSGQQQSSAGNNNAAAPPLPVRLSPRASLALLVKKVEPKYPASARAEHIQEQVMMMVRISSHGEVSEVNLIKPDPLFGQAAIDAVKQWKYKPYLVNGLPVEVETPAVITFELPVPAATTNTAPSKGVVGDMPGGFPDDQASSITRSIVVSAEPMPRVAAPGRIRISQGVSQGLLVEKVAPEYPPEARKTRIQGTVLLHVILGKSGDVTRVDLISGHPLLAPAAMDAVKQWKYKPYRLNGKPVEVETQVQVNFTLS
jgi:TonB family protein